MSAVAPLRASPSVRTVAASAPTVQRLQRKCACASTAAPSSDECAECGAVTRLQRRVDGRDAPDDDEGARRAAGLLDEVLGSSGAPLDAAERAFMEPRFAHGFGDVRVHTGARAAAAARSVHAQAFTVGRDIVFDSGRYAPGSAEGRQLIAHELTHVVQQRGAVRPGTGGLSIDAADSASEREAERIGAAIAGAGGSASGSATEPALPGPAGAVGQHSAVAHVSRASAAAPDAALLAINLGSVARTGLQFVPNDVTDTAVGPPEVRGGLLDSGAPRLNVIVGENQTLRTLAIELLPLWVTATPFTPTGVAAALPLDLITPLELAQGLLVYSQTYLPVPAMTRWRAGLRLPLPVRIDEATHTGILHPLNIRALASAFDAAWLPLLDQRASASVAPPAATVRADATAFLVATPDALGRGIALGARAVTNATAELPFIREVFVQLGAAAFDVALQFMDFLVNREISLLAAQDDGAAILAQIGSALAALPAAPSATQQASLARANRMLALVAGVVPQAGPGAMRTRAEKTVTIDTVKLDGSSRDAVADVATANSIYAQCNVRLVPGINATATAADTAAWVGRDRICATGTCTAASVEERTLMAGATARFGLSSRLRAFYLLNIGSGARAESFPPYCATGGAASVRNMIKITNNSNGRTLAHETGHILLNNGDHPANLQRVMGPAGGAPQGEAFLDSECSTLYANA